MNSSSDLDLRPVEIETRRDLVNYINNQVPGNFFFTEKALDKGKDAQDSVEREYDAPLLQREIEIVGQILLRSTHVKLQECDGPELYRNCYPILDLEEGQFATDDLTPGARDDPNLSWAIH